jgi:tripartite-type tricarboxylate transporter receptor subunit TctC
MIRATRRALVAGGAVLLAGPALAQDAWPSRPIRIIVPFAPGGPTDVMGRVVAQALSGPLGQPLVVENRAGGGGNVGTAAVARAAPDGYTILVASTGFVVNVSLFRMPGYDIREFAPVTELGASPNVLLSRPDSGIDSIATLLDRARTTARRLDMTNPGLGSTPHLTVELLQIRAGVEFVQVPHNSAGLAIQSLLAGTTQVGCTALPAAHAHIKSGALRALALTSEARWPDLAEVPTMLELGWPGFVSETFQGMLVPAATPAPIIDRLARATVSALREPETKARLLSAGFAVRAAGPEALARRVAAEVPLWRDVIETAKIEKQ